MSIFKNVRLWIIIALVTVVLGAVMFSVFGLNQTADYRSAYEVTVSVDQNVQNSGDLVKKTAEKYFDEIGYKFVSYATEKTEDGSTYIYKFNKAGDVNEAILNEKLENAFKADEKLKDLNLVAKSEYKKTAISFKHSVGGTIAACIIGLAITFIVSLIMLRLASALTITCNAVMTAIIYIALLSITRIPALPDFIVAAALSMMLSAVMSFGICCTYKEKLRLDEKAVLNEVAAEGVKDNAVRLYFIAGVAVAAAVVLSATCSVYLVFTGLKILFATVSAFLVSCVATPALWTVFKNFKSKK